MARIITNSNGKIYTNRYTGKLLRKSAYIISSMADVGDDESSAIITYNVAFEDSVPAIFRYTFSGTMAANKYGPISFSSGAVGMSDQRVSLATNQLSFTMTIPLVMDFTNSYLIVKMDSNISDRITIQENHIIINLSNLGALQ